MEYYIVRGQTINLMAFLSIHIMTSLKLPLQNNTSVNWPLCMSPSPPPPRCVITQLWQVRGKLTPREFHFLSEARSVCISGSCMVINCSTCRTVVNTLTWMVSVCPSRTWLIMTSFPFRSSNCVLAMSTACTRLEYSGACNSHSAFQMLSLRPTQTQNGNRVRAPASLWPYLPGKIWEKWLNPG